MIYMTVNKEFETFLRLDIEHPELGVDRTPHDGQLQRLAPEGRRLPGWQKLISLAFVMNARSGDGQGTGRETPLVLLSKHICEISEHRNSDRVQFYRD